MMYPIIRTIVTEWNRQQSQNKAHPRLGEILDLLDIAADAIRLARDIETDDPREAKTYQELKDSIQLMKETRTKNEWEATEKEMLAEMEKTMTKENE